MGNTFAKDNDTIHWKSLKTENISDNKKYNFMSEDSKQLLEKLELNLPKLSENTDLTSDLSIFSKNDSPIIKSLVGGGDINTDTEIRETIHNSLSSSSPFISSEVYNLLMNKGNIQKGGKMLDDDSSTSSTSSSLNSDDSDDSDDSSSEEMKKKKKSKTKSKKNLKGGKKMVSSESNELSYVSSSAHTNKRNSESDVTASVLLKSENETELNGGYQSSSDDYISSSKSNKTTENSTIQNLNNSLPDSSIRTSDIHMITE